MESKVFGEIKVSESIQRKRNINGEKKHPREIEMMKKFTVMT